MVNKNKITKLLQVSISGFAPWASSWTELNSVIDSKILVALNFFVGFSALIAVALLVVAGYNFITSMGEAEKVEKAQKGATAAIVGMIIVLVARVLVELVIKIVVSQSV